MSLKTFIKNTRYLFIYNLKEIMQGVETASAHANYMKYIIKSDYDKIFIPHIAGKMETIEYILKNKISVCRFGDGEFSLIKGEGIVFQKHNPVLQRRLSEILKSKNEKIQIAIPWCMTHEWMGGGYKVNAFNRKFYGENNDWIVKNLEKDRLYLDSTFTCLSNIQIYNLIRKIWQDKDVTLICGDRLLDKIKHNVFDNAKSIEYQFAPTTNAFEKYDEILKNALTISKDRLVVVVLGPTATVLTYDLANNGYQALDMGHVLKGYDLILKNTNLTQKDKIEFYDKD